MAIKKLIKRFDFKPQNYSDFDLSGGLRLNVSSFRLELPLIPPGVVPTPGVEYNTSQTLTAATKVTNPLNVKSWIGFAVEHPRPAKHPDPNISTSPFTIRFRLTDGAIEMYHDGANWVAATLDSHWNTEAEVADEISSFPVTNRKLGVVVNMYTAHKSVTPKLKSIKVLYEADINEQHDLIYKSLMPELKEQLAIRSRVAYRMPSTSSTISLADLKLLGFDTGYKVVDVQSAYNFSTDPNKLIDIVQSYDTNTKLLTFTSSVTAGEIAWVNFSYVPVVAAQTSRDYSEVSSIPSVEIMNVTTNEKVEHTGTDDAVLNVSTGDGWKVPGPRVADVSLTIEVTADKQSDLSDMADSIRKWISQSQSLRMRGTDETFQMQITGGPVTTSVPNNKNLRMARMSVVISNVAFYERPAVTAKKLDSIVFGGNGNIAITVSQP